MANEPLESIKFPGIADKFTVPAVDNTLAVQGAVADAKAVGDEISDIKADLSELDNIKPKLNILNAEQHAVGVGYPVEEPDTNVYFADEDGIIGIILRDGFDSKNAGGNTETYFHPDFKELVFIDDDGNVLGSPEIYGISKLAGKKVSIIGDSISTYDGYIPSGYKTAYPMGDVNSVEKTWWWKLLKLSGMELLVNASWSGSVVGGNTKSTNPGWEAWAACSDRRISDIKKGSEMPDFIFCFISTNDWSVGREIGTFNSSEEVDTTSTEITIISKAYALMLYKLRVAYPNAKIYCITAIEGRHANDDTTFPIVNSAGETIYELNEAVTKVARIFGARIIDLQNCGIHFWNVSDYTVDGMHPNNAGTTLISDYIYGILKHDFE